MNPFNGIAMALALGWLSWLSPVEGTLLAVFLFAGLHNWVELRYFLARWPSRWGTQTPFLATGLAGAFLLTLWRFLSGWGAFQGWFNEQAGFTSGTAWNAALLGWLALLALLSGERHKRRLLCFVFFLVAAVLSLQLKAWVVGVALVFAHPLVSLLFLYRSHRSDPRRVTFFKGLVAGLVMVCAGLWFYVDPWPAPTTDPLWSQRIAWQVGWPVLGINPGFLISTHLFLELVHYMIWVLIFPAWGFRIRPHDTRTIPLAQLSPMARRAIKTILVGRSLFV
ncbi:MAG: hypothetical protein AB7F75_10140, partial [Planctomycetota bacterium]